MNVNMTVTVVEILAAMVNGQADEVAKAILQIVPLQPGDNLREQWNPILILSPNLRSQAGNQKVREIAKSINKADPSLIGISFLFYRKSNGPYEDLENLVLSATVEARAIILAQGQKGEDK